MQIVFILVSIYVIIKTIFYGIYEIKENNNKVGGIASIALSIIASICLNFTVLFRMHLVTH